MAVKIETRICGIPILRRRVEPEGKIVLDTFRYEEGVLKGQDRLATVGADNNSVQVDWCNWDFEEDPTPGARVYLEGSQINGFDGLQIIDSNSSRMRRLLHVKQVIVFQQDKKDQASAATSASAEAESLGSQSNS